MAITLNGTTGITTPALDSEGNLEYSGTLTGGTGVINIGSGQVVKDANGNVGIGTSSPATALDLVGEINFSGNTASFPSNSQPRIYRSGSSAGSHPFDSFGHLVIQARGDGSNRDIVFATGTAGANKTVITSAGNVGIGTGSPSQRLHVVGNAIISGSLSKGSGSFKIDHPIKPETHHLVHSFIEGPQADNIYRGKATLVDGRAVVNIDEAAKMTDGTFVALNREVQCFTSNESDWDAMRGSVSGNILTIECQNTESTATVSWLVIGERQDQHMYDTDWTDENGKVIVEPVKIDEPEIDTLKGNLNA